MAIHYLDNSHGMAVNYQSILALEKEGLKLTQ
jgi:hypothetical protein